jgi:CheY-like chemotaxis protein
MPICDGVEAARRIRQAEERRAVHTALPIVALSADAQESTKKMCLSNGFTAFFSKPLKKGKFQFSIPSVAPLNGLSIQMTWRSCFPRSAQAQNHQLRLDRLLHAHLVTQIDYAQLPFALCYNYAALLVYYMIPVLQ